LKSERCTLVLEAVGDGKLRVTCQSWEDARTILADQALEVVALGKILHVMRAERPVEYLNLELSGVGRARDDVTGALLRRNARRYAVTEAVTCDGGEAMSIIEAEKKRLQDFLAEQTAAHEASKKRAREHCDNAVALADFVIKTLQDHVAKQIAATDAHA
jgi:hypothetical protein